MSLEPRKRLFHSHNTLTCENRHNSTNEELDAMLEKAYNDFTVKYSIDNGSSKVKKRKIDWCEEDESNLPEFYSRHPKRKCLTAIKLVDSTLLLLRKDFENMNIRHPLHG